MRALATMSRRSETASKRWSTDWRAALAALASPHRNENHFVAGRVGFYCFTQQIAARRKDFQRQGPGVVPVANEGNPKMRLVDVAVIVNVLDAQPLFTSLIEIVLNRRAGHALPRVHMKAVALTHLLFN